MILVIFLSKMLLIHKELLEFVPNLYRFLQLSPEWTTGWRTPPSPTAPSSWTASSSSPPGRPRPRRTAAAETVSRRPKLIPRNVCEWLKMRVRQRSDPVKRRSINHCQLVSCRSADRLIRTPKRSMDPSFRGVFVPFPPPPGALVRQKYVLVDLALKVNQGQVKKKRN